ncbi:carbohydrate-binding module family 12 protein [Mycena alexandri]|uniref:Carbohydrate-binding module family 12 protein n=1 Tax=Mycena alexandri TaxID=1745969 RepID=A0AAD6T686_9AGAR|nr:carbohydrate-binding module family 12 protein [Mycena alexandri]
MTNYWEPGVAYSSGAVVEFEGSFNRTPLSRIGPRPKLLHCGDALMITIAAKTTTNNTRNTTTAKTTTSNQPDHGHHGSDKQQDGQEGQTVTVHREEREKHWYDIDDHRKKELEVGGGLLAGAALLAGGYAAYQNHAKNEEEKKAQTWALQNWIQDAKARTEQYRQTGARSPATWILNHGKEIPQGAIAVGREHNWTLYICRAFYEGGVQIGKASDAFEKGGVIGYRHEEIQGLSRSLILTYSFLCLAHQVGTYEILIGDMNGLRWVDASGPLDVNNLGYTPVEGGREPDGTPLYIAEAPYNGAVHPGKASKNLDGAYIPYDGTEKNVKSYRVLCYA